MKNSLIYRILKYGNEHEVFTKKEILRYFKNELGTNYFKSISASSKEVNSHTVFYKYFRYKTLKYKTIATYNSPQTGGEKIALDEHYRITPFAHSRYLQMVEQQAARKSGNRTKTIAGISIGIALILGVLAISMHVFTNEVKVVEPPKPGTIKMLEAPIGKRIPQDTIGHTSGGHLKRNFRLP